MGLQLKPTPSWTDQFINPTAFAAGQVRALQGSGNPQIQQAIQNIPKGSPVQQQVAYQNSPAAIPQYAQNAPPPPPPPNWQPTAVDQVGNFIGGALALPSLQRVGNAATDVVNEWSGNNQKQRDQNTQNSKNTVGWIKYYGNVIRTGTPAQQEEARTHLKSLMEGSAQQDKDFQATQDKLIDDTDLAKNIGAVGNIALTYGTLGLGGLAAKTAATAAELSGGRLAAQMVGAGGLNTAASAAGVLQDKGTQATTSDYVNAAGPAFLTGAAIPVAGAIVGKGFRSLTGERPVQPEAPTQPAPAQVPQVSPQDQLAMVRGQKPTPAGFTVNPEAVKQAFIEEQATRPKVTLKNNESTPTVKPVKGTEAPQSTTTPPANPYSKDGTGRPLTEDDNLLNIKRKTVKDETRKGELDAEYAAKHPEKPQVTSKTNQKPNILSRVIMSVSHNLRQFGTAGKNIDTGIQSARNNYEKRVGNVFRDLKVSGFNKVSDEEFSHIVDAIEGGTINKLPQEHRVVAKAVQKALRDTHNHATNGGMNIGDKGDTYFPHWFKDGDKTGVGLVERQFNQRFGNLEKKRVDENGGYEKTKESAVRYLQNANDRISKAEQFGQNDEILGQHFEQAAKEGYDPHKLAEYANTGLGNIDYASSAHQVSSGISKLNAITSLQKAFISNLSQGVNTASITGLRNAGKAYQALLTDPEIRDWAARAGVAGDHITGQIQEAYAGINNRIGGDATIRNIQKHVLVPGMQATEHFNREHAVVAGKLFMEDLERKAAGNGLRAKSAQRILGRYIEGYKPGAALTDGQIINGARNVVKNSQFKVDPIDLPRWASGSVGKLIAQFRSFGYKQTQFFAREVFGEALHGNFGPMTRIVAVGVPVGYGVAEARNFVSGKPVGQTTDENGDTHAQTLGDMVAEGAGQIAGGSLAASEVQSLQDDVKFNHGNTDRQIGAIAADLAGPTAGNANRLATASSDAINGKPKALVKFGTSKLPVVGGVVSNLAFPSSADSKRFASAIGKAQDAVSGDARDKASFSEYLARNKNPDTGKSIQLSPAESIENSRNLFDNDKLRKTITEFEKSANKDHAPMWDLPDDQLKQYLQYKAQYTGDDAKSHIRDQATRPDGSNWIDDITKKQEEFYKKLPPGNGPGSEKNAKTPTYPEFDDATKSLLDTYSKADAATKRTMMQDHGGELSTTFNKIAQYTNAMRRAEGAPEKNDYPVADAETQKIMATYNALPQHDGKRGGNATRFAWGQAHPDEYAKMQAYLTQATLHSLIAEAGKASFKGTTPSQKLLADIKNLGQYDITSTKLADGTSQYALATNQNGGSSGSVSKGYSNSYSSSKGSGGSSGGKKGTIKSYGFAKGSQKVQFGVPHTAYKAPKVKAVRSAAGVRRLKTGVAGVSNKNKPKVALKNVGA